MLEIRHSPLEAGGQSITMLKSKRKGNERKILAHTQRLRSLTRAGRKKKKNEALLVPANEITYLIFKSAFIAILEFLSVKT